MWYRLRCPTCGKSIRVSSADVGQAVCCAACGGRARFRPGQELPSEVAPTPAGGPDDEAVGRPVAGGPAWDEDALPRAASPSADGAPSPLPPTVAGVVPENRPETRPTAGGGGRWPAPAAAGVAFAVVAVGSAVGIGAWLGRTASQTSQTAPTSQTALPPYSAPLPGVGAPSAGPTPASAGETRRPPDAGASEFWAIRSEAESRALAGDRAAALDAYDRLFALASARPPTDPLAQRALLAARVAAERIGYVDGSAAPPPLVPPPAPATASATPPDRDGSRVAVPAGPATRPSGPREAVPDGSIPAPPEVAALPPATAPATAPAVWPEPRIRLTAPAVSAPDDLDARVDQAIRRGAEYLMGLNVNDVGQSALAVYAIVAAGQAVDDPRLSARGSVTEHLVGQLKQAALSRTYHRSIRACTLALHNRPQDRTALTADVNWLVDAAGGQGNYTYVSRRDERRPTRLPSGIVIDRWDNSNSQYGVYGVWAGAEAGVEVSSRYWEQVDAHWRRSQLASGEWPYSSIAPSGRFTMTCAGVVSMTITHDHLRAADAVGRMAANPMPPALARSLDWLDRSANDQGLPLALDGYAVFGLERVGLATGIKYFGKHDWYRELAEQLVAAQRPDGSWDVPGRGRGLQTGLGPVVNSSFAVLFLARGRHPVMVNKLRHDGDWYNRPRDAANVTRFVSRAVERPMNWQVVNLERPGADWLDAPILYVSSRTPIRFGAADYDKLGEYVRAGGLIFLHADGGATAFADWARREFVPKVCPGLPPLAPLPPGHGLFRAAARLPPGTRLEASGNGSRPWVVLSPDDVAGAWQGRDEKTKRAAFDLMLNLFVYATDNVPPRNRLVTPVVPDPPADPPPVATFAVARVRHEGRAGESDPPAPADPAGVDGDWDPEPEAWPRFAKLFRWQTGAAADVRVVTAAELGAAAATPARPPLAHLTGTAPFAVTDATAAGLRAYVEAGGVLLVEACGGSGAFAAFADETLVPAAFPGMALEDAAADQAPLAKTQPVADDLAKRKVRPYALAQPAGRLVGLRKGRWGKGWVVVSRYDLTTGLLGSNVSGIVGFAPDYCVGVVKNLLVWAGTMGEDPAGGARPATATVPAAGGGTSPAR